MEKRHKEKKKKTIGDYLFGTFEYSGGSNSELGIPNTIPIPNILKFGI